MADRPSTYPRRPLPLQSVQQVHEIIGVIQTEPGQRDIVHARDLAGALFEYGPASGDFPHFETVCHRRSMARVSAPTKRAEG